LVKFAQLLASGLQGNLLGEGIGGAKSGRRERRCHSGCSVKYVGRATSLSLFIGNNRARKPLIAPNRFMT